MKNTKNDSNFAPSPAGEGWGEGLPPHQPSLHLSPRGREGQMVVNLTIC
ncbi:hypothetical protein SAMN02746062_00705 [Alysiella filiformis DSM 16848]|uniref:Uncharacterized protein n=1 Tax=Alysiella filiformis DSM 16848 TaxID=1120981 RepID=A0A286E772_9NEIS|nr:hypothetical protein [Alysiella filiformis]SOD66704.1 hypothetical protein SAMN02746062_00705 [Alysiella filiformis DSM 16848]